MLKLILARRWTPCWWYLGLLSLMDNSSHPILNDMAHSHVHKAVSEWEYGAGKLGAQLNGLATLTTNSKSLTMGLWPRTTISSLSQSIEVGSKSILRSHWNDVIGVTASMHYLICGSWTRLHHVCDGATWDRDIGCWVHEEPHVHMFPFFFWRCVTQDRNITRTEHGNASCTCLLVGLVSREIWIRCSCGITTSHLFPHLCSKTATLDKDVRHRCRRHEVDLMQACRPLHFER